MALLSTFRNFADQVANKVTSFGSANILHPHNRYSWLVEEHMTIIGFLIKIIEFIKMTRRRQL